MSFIATSSGCNLTKSFWIAWGKSNLIKLIQIHSTLIGSKRYLKKNIALQKHSIESKTQVPSSSYIILKQTDFLGME